jgi:hypothetical protein
LSGHHVIVWDLDLTLGDFSALNHHAEGSGPITVLVRPGIADVLRTLTEAGFLHTVLTLATPLYAETSLRATGLREFFERVEGLGQRTKGDAVGIGDCLGIAARDRPHRMLFVGDHPLFDAPQDPRVVFHLEPFALARPAEELLRLVMHLRDAGSGSLRRGFDRTAAVRSGWRKWLPFGARVPVNQPVRRSLAGVGDVLFLACAERCPVVGFENRPVGDVPATACRFVPEEVMAPIRAESAKEPAASSADAPAGQGG